MVEPRSQLPITQVRNHERSNRPIERTRRCASRPARPRSSCSRWHSGANGPTARLSAAIAPTPRPPVRPSPCLHRCGSQSRAVVRRIQHRNRLGTSVRLPARVPGTRASLCALAASALPEAAWAYRTSCETPWYAAAKGVLARAVRPRRSTLDLAKRRCHAEIPLECGDARGIAGGEALMRDARFMAGGRSRAHDGQLMAMKELIEIQLRSPDV